MQLDLKTYYTMISIVGLLLIICFVYLSYSAASKEESKYNNINKIDQNDKKESAEILPIKIWYFYVLLHKYAIFSGRASRSEYWGFFIVNSIIGIILFALAAEQWSMLGYSLGTSGTVPDGFFSGWNLLYVIYSVAVLPQGIAVTIRRLHDTGRSGWWLFPPFALFATALYFNLYHFGFFAFFNLIAIIVSLILSIMIFIFMLLDSQQGDNKYGKNPKQESKKTEQVKQNETNKTGHRSNLTFEQELENLVNHAISYPYVFVKLIPSQFPITISDLKKYPEKDAKGMIFGVLANLSGKEISFNSDVELTIMAALARATDRIYEGICK